jgi:hypothetical protein
MVPIGSSSGNNSAPGNRRFRLLSKSIPMRSSKWPGITVLFLLLHYLSFAQQLSLGKTPHILSKAAVLDLNADNQGLLLPRIADTSLINVLNPQDGMMIYFTPTKQLFIRANSHWQALSNTALLNNYWAITGNTNGGTGRFGTADNFDLPFITNNTERLRIRSNGFVGIGTASPSALLHLAGTNPLTMTGVQTGTSTTADSLLTITSGVVRKLPVAAFQQPLTLTTTGTSGAATFNGTTLNIPQYVGFANPMTATGDLIYGGASGTATRLAGNPTTARQFLISTGTGSAATAPVWGSLQGSDIPNNAVTYNKIQDVTASTLLGRYATTNGVAQEITIGTGLSLNSSTGVLSTTNRVLTFEFTFSSNRNVSGAGFVDVPISLPTALTSTRATVAVSPNIDMPEGLFIAWAYATNTTNIKIKIMNASTTTQTIPAGSKLYITITEF